MEQNASDVQECCILPVDDNAAFQGKPPLLAVSSFSLGFSGHDGKVADSAVSDLSFTLRRGESFCLVGESGCGKSVTAHALMGLLPSPPAHILGGSICFDGQELSKAPQQTWQKLRGERIGMVFQEPMTSLNPVFTIGRQVAEGIRLHQRVSKAVAMQKAVAMLDKVGIPQAARRAGDYPHQMSGGMRQRVMIAMALACKPDLLIADEPTTALDVTLQGQILELITTLVRESNSALLLITHDFGVVEQVADTVAVMYAGRIVEKGAAGQVLYSPLHPYTQGLLASCPPRPGKAVRLTAADRLQSNGLKRRPRLSAIPGVVPPPGKRPRGCVFHPRCPHVLPVCRQEPPGSYAPETPGHNCACWLYAGAANGGE